MDQSIYSYINKLRALEEAEADAGTTDAQPAQGATSIDAYKPNDGIPEIKANTLAQAKATALKQLGVGKKFRFCQMYSTQTGSRPPQPQPAAAQDQWSYLGGNNVKRPSVKEALAALRRAARLDELKIGDIDPRNGKKIASAAVNGSGNVIMSGTGEIWNVQYAEPDAPAPAASTEAEPVSAAVASPVTSGEVVAQPLDSLPAQPQPAEEKKCTIEDQARIKYMPSFNKAFAAARKAGCDKFMWCGIYTTKEEANPQPVTDIPAATGNTNTYAQGINMALSRAKLKGVIGKTGPYTEQDVKKVLAGLADGTIGYQLDPKSHTPEQIATYSRMLRNQMLQGDKRAGSNYSQDVPRVYK